MAGWRRAAGSSKEMKHGSQDVTASSLLGALTSNSATNYLPLPYNNDLLFSIVVDNNRKLHGEIVDDLPGAIRFPCETIALIVYPQMDQVGNPVVLLFGEACDPLTEWYCTAQLRIKCGPATKLKDASPDAVVELGDFEREAFTELLYQIYDTIRPISANFVLLSKAAIAYRADRILERITSYLLSLDVDLEQKLKAAVELELDDALGEIVFRAEQRGEWTQLISKGFEPSSLGREVYRQIVCPAIIEASIHKTFQKKGSEILLPMKAPILKCIVTNESAYSVPIAKLRRYGYSCKKCENNVELSKSNPPFTVSMKLADKTLHINKGIIELHNTKGFIRKNSRELTFSLPLFRWETLPAESHALNWGCLSFNEFFCASLDEIELRQSAELGALCARAGITVVDLVELMFRHIYPQHDLVPAHCLRPMMLLAHDNGMCKLLNLLGNVSALFFFKTTVGNRWETLPAESHALNWGCLSFNEFFCASLDEIELRQSAELGSLCARAGITVVDLVELMFRHIYPQHDLVPAHCLRPMMLLAHDNGMCKLLNSLGNALSLEPPITAEMILEHFELADRYQHSNLLQASLLRIEGSFRGKASGLVTLPRFKDLAEEIKMQILDRHCSGWALFDRCLAGRPTKRIRRVLTLDSGGPLEPECDSETSLQYPEESLSDEAFGAPRNVIIN
uniref:BTB domain-containing protein n=1 Tax=Ascaris lumbricoides TaxID=6252 RepID=A0A9J2PN95_ASCLU